MLATARLVIALDYSIVNVALPTSAVISASPPGAPPVCQRAVRQHYQLTTGGDLLGGARATTRAVVAEAFG